MKKQNDDHLFSDLVFFSGMAEEDRRDFCRLKNIRDYSKGEHLFRQGDKADRFFVILQGRIKRYLGTSDGREVIVTLFTRGDVLGGPEIFENTNYYFSAEAAEDTQLIEIPVNALKIRAKENPDIMVSIIAAMARDMHKLQIENEHKTLMDAPQRIGCLLLQLSSGLSGTGGAFDLPYDKSLAAQSLGMRPETFSRALAELKSIGVVASTRGSTVSIENFSRLIDFCCGQCTSLPGECRGSQRDRSICKDSTCSAKCKNKQP